MRFNTFFFLLFIALLLLAINFVVRKIRKCRVKNIPQKTFNWVIKFQCHQIEKKRKLEKQNILFWCWHTQSKLVLVTLSTVINANNSPNPMYIALLSCCRCCCCRIVSLNAFFLRCSRSCVYLVCTFCFASFLLLLPLSFFLFTSWTAYIGWPEITLINKVKEKKREEKNNISCEQGTRKQGKRRKNKKTVTSEQFRYIHFIYTSCFYYF